MGLIGRMGIRACGLALVLAALALPQSAMAQSTPAAPQAAPPAAEAPPPAAPQPAPPGFDFNKPSADASGGVEVMLEARSVLSMQGDANWDDGYARLMESFQALTAEAQRLNLPVSGRPLALFLETDDMTFRFRAMVPVSGALPPGTNPKSGIELGQTPIGKAIRFPQEGAYDEIDAAYEAITAYLDEKGLTAKGQFLEEYLNEPPNSEDPSLKMNIYVFIE